MSHHLVRKVIPLDMAGRNSLAASILNSASTSAWNSLDLIQILLSLGDGPCAAQVREILDVGAQQSPDLLLLAFSHFLMTENSIVANLGPKLVLSLIGGHPHAPIVLPRVWQLNPDLFIAGLFLMYSEDQNSISRILDISQELKALAVILETRPFKFAIDLAALASRREYLNLEIWLNEHIRDHGDPFFRACLDFLNDKVSSSQSPRPEIAVIPLSIEVTRIFLRILHDNASSVNQENAEYLRRLLVVCSQAFPRIENNSAPETTEQEPQVTFPADLEAEVLKKYEDLYKGEISIPQMIDALKTYRGSNSPRDVDIFKCMVQYLFDEYKYFPRYPERQLLITGVLFGGLIQNEIVTSMALGIALRYVLEALRQAPGSLLFKFGLHALAQFQPRLGEWPQYCTLLLQIDHLHQSCPEIIRYIQSIPMQPPTDLDNPQDFDPADAKNQDEGTSVFSALNLAGILPPDQSEPSETPSEQTQDKILFIINNLAFSNLEAKVSEFLDIFSPAHQRWFSHYIVVKRASIEPNFHALYISFLDLISIPRMNSIILHETLSEIRDLLNSDKTISSSQERSLLKNLGIWLGSITLAKHIPIKHQHLSFKDLLLQGYDSKRLIVVIPFVCKVLEQASTSFVFKPPNPWLMAVMRLLVELYHFAELKLNLKFEVEVLCKNLNLDIKG